MLPDFGWTRRNQSGLWLPGPRWFPGMNPNPGCCGENETPECGYCNFGVSNCVVPYGFVFDLGVGGWVIAEPASGCGGFCEGIAGEFNLENRGSPCGTSWFCFWWIENEELGECDTCLKGVDYKVLFDINLAINARPGGWRYYSYVALFTSFGIVTQGSSAVYISNDFTTEDCLEGVDGDGKITLTKDGADIHRKDPWVGCDVFLCQGALPDTIKIWPDNWPP